MDGGVAAGAASAIAALVAAVVAWRKGGTENWTAVFAAQGKHLDVVTAENADLRTRQTQQEQDFLERMRRMESRLDAAMQDTARCEADKVRLQQQIDLLMEERRGPR